MDTPTFGIKASQQNQDMAALLRLWTTADDAGFDSCWAFDHLAAMGRDRTGDIFEAWTLLAAVARETRRVRIGTLVTGAHYRHPVLLAKMAVTVDHLSGGRLTMGIGAGGDPYADTMAGLALPPARDRIARLREACDVLKLLWTEDEATYKGAHYRLDHAVANPKPVQRPRPPLWIGSSGERYGLRVVAEHADVWLNASMRPDDVDELVRLSAVLDAHCAEIGRDPAEIGRAVQFRAPSGADATLRAVERYLAAGFRDLVFMPYDGAQGVEELAALLPRLRALG
ncbi:MAG TPA: LLM class flavin-dependent oxidoreductase [Streptosporangiaceae bacterium]|jgi:alkanesulfonate monooxygenase SsuD/methylene tetrahydromethanopterin reductase-like flavin-dependent oxidoreductase (luciferase family)